MISLRWVFWVEEVSKPIVTTDGSEGERQGKAEALIVHSVILISSHRSNGKRTPERLGL
jgi:hypothetical protein